MDLLPQLAEITGPAHVLTAEADMAAYLAEPRGLFHGTALALVKPGSTAEVAAIAALCHARGIAIVPQGGNTGLVGGQIPDRSGQQIILSLLRLNRIRETDLAASCMIVEAGVTLAGVQQAAQAAGRLFPLSLASEGSCTIGGNLSTNAGGTAVLAYGNTRDLVLGIEVVLADGRILPLLSKLKKDNTGYDLKHLFMGAEGTLGIITAASLKLFPKPRSFATAFIGLSSPDAALALLQLAQQQTGPALKTFELMPRTGIEFVLRHAAGTRDPLGQSHGWYVLLELTDTSATGLDDVLASLLADALNKGIVEDASPALSLRQRDAFWGLRESLSEVQKFEGGSIKHDVSLPIARVPEFLRAAEVAVTALIPGARMVPFGHLGDGNIHCNVSQPVGADKAAFLARWVEVNEVIHAIVMAMGGSFSAEHGIGTLKRDLLARYKDPVALAVMRAVKAALDPTGIMNPGKVL